MHLMDETPKIVEKLTEQKLIEEATKKQKKELKDIKIISDRIPVGVPKIGEVYKTTDKVSRMETEKNRIEKQHIENTTKKKEKEDKNRIKTQAELSKYKVPKLNKNLVTEIHIERSAKKRRQHTAAYKRIMLRIILAEKLTPEKWEEFLDFKTNELPGMMKMDDTLLDYLNYQIKFLKGKDILTYYTPCDTTKDKEPLLNRELSDKWLPPKQSAKRID